MTAHYNNYRSTYECVDKDPESVPGLNAWSSLSAHFYHVEPQFYSLSCPPYDDGKELTCVVCSRAAIFLKILALHSAINTLIGM